MPADVEVTAVQDGKRYTLTIERAKSLYAAIFHYNHVVCSGNPRPDYPRPTPETVFEVRELDNAAVWIRTWKQAMDWANRDAARRSGQAK